MPVELDQKELATLLAGGEFSEGKLVGKKEPEFTDTADVIKINVGKVIEPKGKYKETLVDDVKKHPGEYTIMTPRGRMTIKSAMAKGFNQETGEFDRPNIEEEKEKILQEQTPRNKKIIKRLTDPRNAKVLPDQAAEMGMEEGNPMVKKPKRPMEQPVEEEPAEEEQAVDPAMIQAMMGGGM